MSVRVGREVTTHPPRKSEVTDRIYILLPVAFLGATVANQIFDLFGIVKGNVLLVEILGGIFLFAS